MKIRIPEKDIQKVILQYLNLQGHFCYRQNTGAVISEYKGRKRFFRFGVKGASDITGISKDGKRIDIEVKSGYNKPTMDQQMYLDSMKKRGGIAIVAYCLDDVIKGGL
jgi:hypothetical protein